MTDGPDAGEHVEYCRAAYCVSERGHLAPHFPLHYRILDEMQQRNPSHAECGCHPRQMEVRLR